MTQVIDSTSPPPGVGIGLRSDFEICGALSQDSRFCLTNLVSVLYWCFRPFCSIDPRHPSPQAFSQSPCLCAFNTRRTNLHSIKPQCHKTVESVRTTESNGVRDRKKNINQISFCHCHLSPPKRFTATCDIKLHKLPPQD